MRGVHEPVALHYAHGGKDVLIFYCSLRIAIAIAQLDAHPTAPALVEESICKFDSHNWMFGEKRDVREWSECPEIRSTLIIVLPALGTQLDGGILWRNEHGLAALFGDMAYDVYLAHLLNLVVVALTYGE